MKRFILLTAVVCAVAALGGCKSQTLGSPDVDAAVDAMPDVGPYSCLESPDDDDDGISNHDEGVQEERDTDGDLIPDYLDFDSDNDGLLDALEAGDSDLCTPPIDSDADGAPDYRDPDSDNDGCADGDEDLNFDGVVGSCGTMCPNQDPQECGPGQACLANGLCDPPITSACAQGESDPRVADTDGDGVLDCALAQACRPQSEAFPFGRPPAQLYTPSAGVFQIAVEPTASVVEQLIHSDSAEVCNNAQDDDGDGLMDCDDPDCTNTNVCGGVSVTFDLVEPSADVAGFAVAGVAETSSAEQERTRILEQLIAHFGETHVRLRSSGTPQIQLTQHPAVTAVWVGLTGLGPATASGLRSEVIALLLGLNMNSFVSIPIEFGQTHTDFVLSFTVQRREPSVGDPVAVVMGAVASRMNWDDQDKTTYFNVRDAANGSGLAHIDSLLEPECETFVQTGLPEADLLWVLDDATPSRLSIANNAVDIFNRAITYGVDFRMGVVNMASANGGVLCTSDTASDDYFLTPANLLQFQECVLDPQGSGVLGGNLEHGLTQGESAVIGLLPRANAPDRIRPAATLAVIYVSDERAQELEDAGCATDGDPNLATAACMQPLLQPTLNLLLGVSNPEARGTAYAITSHTGQLTDCTPDSEPGQSYKALADGTGGLTGSLCQPNLQDTLRAIFDDIVGRASPIVLAHAPISLTLAVTVDGVGLERSHGSGSSSSSGFSFAASSNAILLVDPPADPQQPRQVIVGYERWVTTLLPPD